MSHADTSSLNARQPEAGGWRLTGGKVLAALVVFFGMVAGANAVMIHMALATFRGEVNDHPYETGLAFNREIAAGRAQASRAWTVDVRVGGEGESRALSISLVDAQGRPLSDLDVAVTLAAPADRRRDVVLALAPVRAGLYEGSAVVAAGQRDLEVVARRGGEILFQSVNRIDLR